MIKKKLMKDKLHLGVNTKLSNFNHGIYNKLGSNCLLTDVQLGDYSYIEPGCDIMYTNIGKFTSIASNVRINPSNHPWWRPTLHHFSYRPGEYGFDNDVNALDDEIFEWRKQESVTIGHDVWIGHGAIIMPGVTVGNGAIIGSGSIVTKDIKAWSIYVGNPAKFLRSRFDDKLSEQFEKLKWWDWPEKKLRENHEMFRKDAKSYLDDFIE